jgi:hypothetical protein
MSEKKFFKNTRDQFIDGVPHKSGDVVEIEESRVEYLISAGFLVETTAPKKAHKAQQQKPQDKPEEPAPTEPAPTEPAPTEPAAEAPVAE